MNIVRHSPFRLKFPIVQLLARPWHDKSRPGVSLILRIGSVARMFFAGILVLRKPFAVSVMVTVWGRPLVKWVFGRLNVERC